MLVVISGCAGQRLEMVDPKTNPAELASGDKTIISVKVTDSKGVVKAVTATVREYTAISLDLNDSGQDGDEVAGDGIWSIAFEVPYGGSGKYNWDFEAFDANGDPVKVATKEGGEEPLTAEAPILVTD
ncbi:MAG: choice-of-anchor X domain-containing protein [Planctomycetota bacterium]